MKKTFLLFMILFSTNVFAKQSTYIGLKNADWFVSTELDGYSIFQNTTKPDGRRYFMAGKAKGRTGFTISVTLEKSESDSNNCDSFLKEVSEKNEKIASDVKFATRNQFKTMEYLISKFEGIDINQKFIRGCAFYKNSYVDINVSKVKFDSGDEKELYQLIDSVSFVSREESLKKASSLDLFQQGSAYFIEQNYSVAITFFAQALENEKKEQKLEQDFWYVLIDNLAMSYGIIGKYEESRAVLEYGISKKPKYPNFYYTLACWYAETKNKKLAIENLSKAFKYKDNRIKGESMPDPKTDDSFKNLMNEPEFRKFVTTLK